MVSMTRNDDVFVIDLGDGENRFTPQWMEELSAAYKEVEMAEGPRALVTTARGKIWSNGLDLDWLLANLDKAPGYVDSVQQLLAQVLTLPVQSVAVIQGHCFAAGALLALAHDTRVMRSDRGYFCLPEVDIGIPFSPGMSNLIQSRLSKKAAHESMTTGRRYGGPEAQEAGIVDAIYGEDEILVAGMQLASELASKAGPTLQAIRTEMYRGAIEGLRANQPLDISGASS